MIAYLDGAGFLGTKGGMVASAEPSGNARRRPGAVATTSV